MSDLQDRVAELEDRARRFKLATSGMEGWENYFQNLIMQERDYFFDLMAETVAQFHRQIRDETKALLDTALTMRVRGTYQPGVSYTRGDLVVSDGASFLAKCDSPGPLPSSGNWQLVAKQGPRGRDGAEGKRGPPGAILSGWILDRSNFRVTPRFSDGTLGPPLELRELFEPENTP